MRELPKSVIERLKASAPLSLHPDADMLTAFAERALPASEQAVVLEHLARCGDCREVVALAVPMEVVESAGAGVRLHSRWRWPVLRGAVVAAGVIAVAAVGIYRYEHRAPANLMVARSVEQNQVATPSVANETGTAARMPQTVEPSAGTRHEGVSSQSAPVAGKSVHSNSLSDTTDAFGWRAKSVGVAGGSAGGSGSGVGPARGSKMAMALPPRDLDFAAAPEVMSAQTKKQIPAPLPGRQDAPAAVSETVEVQSQAESLTTESRAPAQTLDRQSAELNTALENTEDKVRRAKPAATVGGPAVAPSATPPGAPLMAARNQLDLKQDGQSSTPRWTISSTGGLQRSWDGGKTWHDVTVKATPGLYASSMQLVSSDPESKDRDSDERDSKEAAKRLAKEKAVKTAPVPVFRSVAAIDNEVWGGASGGVLYHSVDAGALWTAVIPTAQGVTLSGDIIRVEFSDTLHGRIATSTGEIWVTADGGQSWQKQ